MALITDLSPELLIGIFYTVLRSSPYGLQILCVLVRTCRAFFEPAANILWRALSSLAPLAFLLPQDAWTLTGEGGPYDAPAVITLRRALLSSDFARFETYTRRVKSYGFYPEVAIRPPGRYYVLSPDALSAFCRHQFQPSLSPSLHVLDLLGLHGTKLAPLMSMFFSPGLETVTTAYYPTPDVDQEQEEISALLTLPEKCPRLLDLEIHGSEVPTSFAETIAKIVSQLQAIRVLSLAEIPMEMNALRALSSCRALQRLTFCVQSGSEPCDAFAIGLAGKGQTFPALAELSMTVDAAPHATRFLAYVTSSYFYSLTINLRQAVTPSQLEDLFSALSFHPSHRTSVREVDIRTQACPDNDHLPSVSSASQHCITLRHLLPLLGLRLRVLVLTGVLVAIDDGDLKRMAQAWPDLRQLALGVYGRHPWMTAHRPHATLFGLIPIFQYCSRIEKVGYRMRTDVLDSEAASGYSRPGKGVVARNGIDLSVGDSRCYEPVQVASFLSDICPKLLGIQHTWLRAEYMCPEDIGEVDVADEEDMYQNWALVVNYVLEFVLIRQQERKSILDQ